MRLQFDICGSAESRADDSRVCRSGCPLPRSRGRGKGISPEEQPCARHTAEIAEVPYQELSRLAGAERSLKCK